MIKGSFSLRPNTCRIKTNNNEVSKKKSLNIMVKDDKIIKVSHYVKTSNTNKYSFCIKSKLVDNEFTGVKGSMPKTTNDSSNFFRKNNNVRDKAEQISKKPFNLFITHKPIIETPKKNKMTVVKKDSESLQNQNILLDFKYKTENSVIQDKLKGVDDDTKSSKKQTKKYSSLVMNINETEKVSTIVDTQINTQFGQTDENLTILNRNNFNSLVDDSACSFEEASDKDDVHASELSNPSRLSNISTKKNNDCKSSSSQKIQDNDEAKRL